ncbi:MAG: T9SS type A sorting domain-containing protein, partial [Flavobacteriales bacterium]
ASAAGANDGAVTVSSDVNLDGYTITWSNEGGGVSIENVGTGSYTVVITDDQGCSTSGSAFVDVASTIAENQLPFTLIANPVNQKVSLDWENETSSFELIDLNGRVIYSGTVYNGLNQFDVSAISSGQYMARVFNSQSSSIQRLVILR